MKALIVNGKTGYDYIDFERFNGFKIGFDPKEGIIALDTYDYDVIFALYSKSEVEKFCENSSKKKSVAQKLLLTTFIDVLNKNLEEKTVFFLDDLKKQVIEKLTIKH